MTREQVRALIRKGWAGKEAKRAPRRAKARLQRERAKLFPELEAALKKAETTIDYLLTTPWTEWERQEARRAVTELRAVLVKAEAIEKEAKG